LLEVAKTAKRPPIGEAYRIISHSIAQTANAFCVEALDPFGNPACG
jgi:hypothetical protein